LTFACYAAIHTCYRPVMVDFAPVRRKPKTSANYRNDTRFWR
jgi:hypothetical protein